MKLSRCVGSGNTLNDFSDKTCFSYQTEDLNVSVFNMITRINESKAFTRRISCECKSRFNGTKGNSDHWWNNDKCWCKCIKLHVCEKGYVWSPATCNCESGKHLESIMDDLTITCDEIIESYNEEIKTIPTNLNEKKATCKA